MIHKCAYPDCFRTLGENGTVKIDGSIRFLCTDHKSHRREFEEMIREFQCMIDNVPDSISPIHIDPFSFSPDA